MVEFSFINKDREVGASVNQAIYIIHTSAHKTLLERASQTRFSLRVDQVSPTTVLAMCSIYTSCTCSRLSLLVCLFFFLQWMCSVEQERHLVAKTRLVECTR